MKPIEITLFGGTGLIGTFLKEIMIKDPFFNKINFVTRKGFKSNHKKIINHIINFSNFEEISNTIKNSKIVYSAIGTTQSKVNWNRNEYRKIDYDINSNVALACKKFQIQNFSFVSTAGANYESNNFYLNLKGEKNVVDFIISQPRFNATYAPAFRHSANWVKKSTSQMESLVQSGKYGVHYCDNNSIILKLNGDNSSENIECFSQEIKEARRILERL